MLVLDSGGVTALAGAWGAARGAAPPRPVARSGAGARPGAVVLTSDPRDLAALVEHTPERVTVVAV